MVMDGTGMSRRRFVVGAASGAAVAVSGGGAVARERERERWRPLFLGTYTSVAGGGSGIGVASYDEVSGRIEGRGTIDGVGDPSYLALHPDRRTLYTVNERTAGAVTAVRLGRGGAGHQVLGERSSGGAGPCHLSVHPGGRWLLSANYRSGSVAVHPVLPSGGLGPLTDLVEHTSPPPGPGQSGPHAHQIVTSPDGGHVLAVDLGNDTVYTYRLDRWKGTLELVSHARTRPGAGPRALAFHPSGRFAYLANELDNTVVVCGYEPRSGRLVPGAPQPTGTGDVLSYPAQLLVTRGGGFAYLANRGHNSLSRYAVEGGGARLRLLGTVPVGGDFPRHVALSPGGRLLFASNQRSGSVSVFEVGWKDGLLRLVGPAFPAPAAVCALPL